MKDEMEFIELLSLVKKLPPEKRQALKKFLEDFDKLYTLGEVEKILRVSRRTIYRYIKMGKLKAVKVHGQWRVPSEEIERIKREGV